MAAEQAWIEAARRLYRRDGEVEVDDDAQVAEVAPVHGTWVQAWVWVPAEEVQG